MAQGPKNSINMKTVTRAVLAMMAIGWLLVTAASAEVYETISTSELETIFKEEGYAVTVNENGNIVWKVEGWKTLVVREKKTGSNLLFRAAVGGTQATLSKVNEWNKKVQFSRTYLDDDGDPVLELDLDLAGGVTRARIVDFLETCRVSLERWRTHIKS